MNREGIIAMKACVLENIGKLVYKEVTKPVPQKGEVLVKIKACGICSSDVDRVFKTGTYHFPTIPGHEFAGEVVDVGQVASNQYIGKNVAVFPLVPCMECDNCKKELFQRCDNYSYFGSRCDGAFAEYIAVPEWNLLVLEDDMDCRLAAMCEPASVAWHSIQRGKVTKSDNVLIVGTGTIGILTAIWAREIGAKKVTVAGRSKEKLLFIEGLGDIHTLNLKEKDWLSQDYDIVFECVGQPETVETSICMAEKGGRIVLVGNPSSNMLLDKNIYWKILRNELTILGTWNSSYGSIINDWKDVLKYMQKNSEKILKLITHEYLLSECREAFETLCNPKEFTIKVMFAIQ